MKTPAAAKQTPAVLSRRAVLALAGLAGIVSALVTLAVAAVISLFFGLANPIIAVGSLMIDLAPPGVKSVVISLFGTGDKAFLLTLLGVLVALLAVLVGILQLRLPPWGISLLCAIGLIAIVASATRANATLLDAAPTGAGVVVGVLVLRVLVRRLDAWRSVWPGPAARPAGGLERRRFLQLAIAAGFASAVVGAGAQVIAAASSAVTQIRKKLALPAAASPAPAIPAGGELTIPGLSPYVIPAPDFYRIDTALQVPSVDPDTWKLRITGMVDNPLEITFAELLALPMQERYITLTCVSQEVGGNLIGNAKWLGYPIRELLARAKPRAGADMVLSTSIDGFTAGSPLSVLQDQNTDALLAVGMNGQPLPVEHGFPVRMVVPGLYGYVSATKWVVEMKVTTFAKDQGYWTPRGWSALGPVKLSSRIDTPTDGSGLKAGTITIAGVAWATHTGISGVQLRIDDGPWKDATLATVVTVDSWLQWKYAWAGTSGNHTIAVRAIDAKGRIQTSAITPPAPNGSTGLHTIQVQVG